MQTIPYMNYRNCISGTVSISITLITSAAAPYLYRLLPRTIRHISLSNRYLGLCLFNFLCTSLMSLVDQQSESSAVFGTIALFRAGQGLAVGVMFVIVQVDIIQLSLKHTVICISFSVNWQFEHSILSQVRQIQANLRKANLRTADKRKINYLALNTSRYSVSRYNLKILVQQLPTAAG